MRISLTAILALASCASERPPAKIEAPEGVVYARNEEIAQECLDYLLDYQSKICALLDAEPRRPVIQVRPWPLGITRHDEIDIAELDGWNQVLVHELVHLHMQEGYWTTLPYGIEDPLCDLIALALAGRTTVSLDEPAGPTSNSLAEALIAGTKKFPVDPPTREQVDRMLVVDQASWLYEAHELMGPGLWTFGQLGFEKLRSLARRAHSSGRERIPPEWILACLPDVWEPVTIDLKTLIAFD